MMKKLIALMMAMMMLLSCAIAEDEEEAQAVVEVLYVEASDKQVFIPRGIFKVWMPLLVSIETTCATCVASKTTYSVGAEKWKRKSRARDAATSKAAPQRNASAFEVKRFDVWVKTLRRLNDSHSASTSGAGACRRAKASRLSRMSRAMATHSGSLSKVCSSSFGKLSGCSMASKVRMIFSSISIPYILYTFKVRFRVPFSGYQILLSAFSRLS